MKSKLSKEQGSKIKYTYKVERIKSEDWSFNIADNARQNKLWWTEDSSATIHFPNSSNLICKNLQVKSTLHFHNNIRSIQNNADTFRFSDSILYENGKVFQRKLCEYAKFTPLFNVWSNFLFYLWCLLLFNGTRNLSCFQTVCGK